MPIGYPWQAPDESGKDCRRIGCRGCLPSQKRSCRNNCHHLLPNKGIPWVATFVFTIPMPKSAPLLCSLWTQLMSERGATKKNRAPISHELFMAIRQGPERLRYMNWNPFPTPSMVLCDLLDDLLLHTFYMSLHAQQQQQAAAETEFWWQSSTDLVQNTSFTSVL